jgi:hypothetical protein
MMTESQALPAPVTTDADPIADRGSRRGEAELTSFMERVSARGEALEAAAARLNQFRGLPADGGPLDERIAAVAERAVADSLESDGGRKPWRAIALVKSEPAA